MDRYRSMLAFVRVAEHAGFASAARVLGVSTSTVSRQVMELEQWLNLQLLSRSTRHVGLTDAGRKYLGECTKLVRDMDAFENRAGEMDSEPRGKIRVTAPVFMGKQLLGPLLPGFLAKFPHVSLELQLLDRFVNLVEEGFDLALRVGHLSDSALVARRLGGLRVRLVASPSYLDQHGTPESTDDLKRHNCLVDTAPRHGNRWPVGVTGRSSTRVSGNLIANSGELIRDLAKAGAGIALLPDFFVASDVAAGDLVPLLEDQIQVAEPGIFLVYPETRHLPSAVRALVDHVLAIESYVAGGTLPDGDGPSSRPTRAGRG